MAPARRLRARVRLGFLWLVVGALALTGIAPARQAFEQRRELAEVSREVAALEQRNAELTDRLNRLDDLAYMEKLAREQLGVVRPGETAYVVVPEPAPVAQVAPAPAPPTLRERVGAWLKERLVDR